MKLRDTHEDPTFLGARLEGVVVSDPDPAEGDAKRRGPSAPVIGAIATVLAAVIAGIFTLIATSNSSGSQQAVTTIQSPLPSGATASLGPSLGGGSNAKYLSDMTPVSGREPDRSNFTDTVGGRAVVKTIGITNGGEAEFVIPADAMRFQATIGLSDGSDPNANGVFTVFGDATELLQQSLNRGYLATVSVSVRGYKVLRLGFASSYSGSVYGDLGLARFTA
jgi:NPCBM/NEW2 domain